MLARLLDDETGATAIEYGLIVAMIAIALIAALQGTGNAFSGTMTKASTTMAAGD
jgi:pilus assembly protein Flp/PilA